MCRESRASSVAVLTRQPQNITGYASCDQCKLDSYYAWDAESKYGDRTGESTDFARAERNYLDLLKACVKLNLAPESVPSLTEPPLGYPTPAWQAGRPRSCEVLCGDSEKKMDSFRYCARGFRCRKGDKAYCQVSWTLERR